MRKRSKLIATAALIACSPVANAYITVLDTPSITETATHYILSCSQANSQCAHVWVAGGSIWVQMLNDYSVWQVYRQTENGNPDEQGVAAELSANGLIIKE